MNTVELVLVERCLAVMFNGDTDKVCLRGTDLLPRQVG